MSSTNDPGHAEYVASQRRRVAEIASDVLGGRVSMIEGARLLTSLCHEIEVAEDDPDLLALVTIESETDALPVGAERANWSIRGLTQKQPELSDAEAWAMEAGAEACRNLARRFGAA
jgi:hypothetical protein